MVVFAVQVDFDSADATGFLEFSKVQFGSKKSFCLSENCSDHVGFFDDAFNFESCVYNILYGKGLRCSRKR